MKPFLSLLLASVLILACHKSIQPTKYTYIDNVKKGLKDSLTGIDFSSLDFSKAARASVDSAGLYFFRIPVKEQNPRENFVMVKTTEGGEIEKGEIVHLKGAVTTSGIRKSWNGSISVSLLNGKLVLASPVKDGYITALRQQNSYRTSSQEPQGHLMQEVIITYSLPATRGDYYWSSWFNLRMYSMDGATSGGGGGYYSDYSGSGGDYSYDGGSGGGDGSTGGGGGDDPVIHIDYEMQDLGQPVDLLKYINCFNRIPDAGATCSIEIFADIPVDNNPNAFFDFTTGSPGHVFINITKQNGNQRASQNLGFYPKSGYKAMTYAPTAGKLVDNEKHEYNTSFSMPVSPAQLSSALVRMQQLSNSNYDVDSYNCTDWALDIFNSVRTNKLEIPLYGIPNSPMTQGSRTPQGLYHKLQQMMNSGHPEKNNITIGIVKGYAGGSTGPCN